MELVEASGLCQGSFPAFHILFPAAYLGSADNAFSPEGTVARKSSADLKKWVALLILIILICEIAEKRLAVFELIQRKFKRNEAQ